MAKKIGFFQLMRGGDTLSDREREMIRGIEDYGAQMNAALHHIDRDPSDIDHFGKDYPVSYEQKLNGTTNGILIRQTQKDRFCQALEVKYSPMGFAPAHTHPHYCVHHVISGEIYDSVRGRRFDKGDWYITSPGQVHSAQSISGAVVEMFCTESKAVAEQIAVIGRYESGIYVQSAVSE
jgi:quercetin dioxygenase-like cupin family protein